MRGPLPDRPKQILVICTANICRSAMAQGLLRQRLAEEGLAGKCEVLSAGVMAVEGQPASGNAVAALAERGIDIADHRARPLERGMIEAADIILTMQEAHRRAVFSMQPGALRKTFLLSEMAGEDADIEDPYGLPLEAYRSCADELCRLICQGQPTIYRWLGMQPAER